MDIQDFKNMNSIAKHPQHMCIDSYMGAFWIMIETHLNKLQKEANTYWESQSQLESNMCHAISVLEDCAAIWQSLGQNSINEQSDTIFKWQL